MSGTLMQTASDYHSSLMKDRNVERSVSAMPSISMIPSGSGASNLNTSPIMENVNIPCSGHGQGSADTVMAGVKNAAGTLNNMAAGSTSFSSTVLLSTQANSSSIASSSSGTIGSPFPLRRFGSSRKPSRKPVPSFTSSAETPLPVPPQNTTATTASIFATVADTPNTSTATSFPVPSITVSAPSTSRGPNGLRKLKSISTPVGSLGSLLVMGAGEEPVKSDPQKSRTNFAVNTSTITKTHTGTLSRSSSHSRSVTPAGKAESRLRAKSGSFPSASLGLITLAGTSMGVSAKLGVSAPSGMTNSGEKDTEHREKERPATSMSMISMASGGPGKYLTKILGVGTSSFSNGLENLNSQSAHDDSDNGGSAQGSSRGNGVMGSGILFGGTAGIGTRKEGKNGQDKPVSKRKSLRKWGKGVNESVDNGKVLKNKKEIKDSEKSAIDDVEFSESFMSVFGKGGKLKNLQFCDKDFSSQPHMPPTAESDEQSEQKSRKEYAPTKILQAQKILPVEVLEKLVNNSKTCRSQISKKIIHENRPNPDPPSTMDSPQDRQTTESTENNEHSSPAGESDASVDSTAPSEVQKNLEGKQIDAENSVHINQSMVVRRHSLAISPISAPSKSRAATTLEWVEASALSTSRPRTSDGHQFSNLTPWNMSEQEKHRKRNSCSPEIVSPLKLAEKPANSGYICRPSVLQGHGTARSAACAYSGSEYSRGSCEILEETCEYRVEEPHAKIDEQTMEREDRNSIRDSTTLDELRADLAEIRAREQTLYTKFFSDSVESFQAQPDDNFQSPQLSEDSDSETHEEAPPMKQSSSQQSHIKRKPVPPSSPTVQASKEEHRRSFSLPEMDILDKKSGIHTRGVKLSLSTAIDVKRSRKRSLAKPAFSEASATEDEDVGVITPVTGAYLTPLLPTPASPSFTLKHSRVGIQEDASSDSAYGSLSGTGNTSGSSIPSYRPALTAPKPLATRTSSFGLNRDFHVTSKTSTDSAGYVPQQSHNISPTTPISIPNVVRHQSMMQYKSLLEYERQGIQLERQLWEEERQALVTSITSIQAENELLRELLDQVVALQYEGSSVACQRCLEKEHPFLDQGLSPKAIGRKGSGTSSKSKVHVVRRRSKRDVTMRQENKRINPRTPPMSPGEYAGALGSKRRKSRKGRTGSGKRRNEKPELRIDVGGPDVSPLPPPKETALLKELSEIERSNSKLVDVHRPDFNAHPSANSRLLMEEVPKAESTPRGNTVKDHIAAYQITPEEVKENLENGKANVPLNLMNSPEIQTPKPPKIPPKIPTEPMPWVHELATEVAPSVTVTENSLNLATQSPPPSPKTEDMYGFDLSSFTMTGFPSQYTGPATESAPQIATHQQPEVFTAELDGSGARASSIHHSISTDNIKVAAAPSNVRLPKLLSRPTVFSGNSPLPVHMSGKSGVQATNSEGGTPRQLTPELSGFDASKKGSKGGLTKKLTLLERVKAKTKGKRGNGW